MGTLLEGLEPFFNTCIDTFSDFDGIVVMAMVIEMIFLKLRKHQIIL